MHGAENDYVYVNCFEEKVADPPALARAISDRHFGIGSDGLILIMPSKRADVRMRMFNPDGSESEMCGNGIRCLAKYAYDHGLCKSREIRVETGAGEKIVTLQIRGGRAVAARVDMGVPDLHRGAIPMKGRPDEIAVNVPIKVLGKTFSATCVSMGNPHCVIFVRNVDAVPLEQMGPVIETTAAVATPPATSTCLSTAFTSTPWPAAISSPSERWFRSDPRGASTARAGSKMGMKEPSSR
jgi:diaminopimelate epimerase